MFAPLRNKLAKTARCTLYAVCQSHFIRGAVSATALTVCLTATSAHGDELSVKMAYVKQTSDTASSSLALFKTPDNSGVAGAHLGIEDSNTTGRFLRHAYSLQTLEHAEPAILVADVKSWMAENPGPVVLDVSDEVMSALLVLPGANTRLFINATNASDSWRVTQCQAGLVHTAPSYAMLGDAIGQFLMAKRWREWFIVEGKSDQDKAMANAFARSAKRFGTEITGRRTWTFDTDLRRTSQQEVPALTQGEDYDAVLVADTANLFGFYLPYNTYLPRPVVGSHGMKAASWHRSIEQWGAIQLQNRFLDNNGRPMNEDDYNAWVAVRAVAEAVTRTQSNNSATLYQYLMSDKFELAAFKGRKLTFRSWNGQLRQPIPLVQPESLVSQSPQQGFLHPNTDLDTLGYDKPEVRCSMAQE